MRRRTLVATAAALALTLAGTAEAVVRHGVGNRIAESGRLGGDIDVSFGPRPVLWQAATGHFPELGLHGGDLTLGKLDGADLDIRAEDVRLKGGRQVTAEEVHADLDIPVEALSAAIAGAGQSGGMAAAPQIALQTDPASGTIVAMAGGMAEIGLRPVLRSGELGIEVAGVTLFGAPAPESVRARMEEQFASRGLTDGEDLEKRLPGVGITGVEVTDAGLRVGVEGEDVSLGRRM